jgi:ATP-binding cassette subfamily F protein uup
MVAKLSGGEKRRLYLCTVLMANPNFLVLDEPTNDLDIQTLNVLEEYLESYKGCVIVISHDRYFMDKIVDHLFVMEGNGSIKDFPGNYSDYRIWREMKRQEEEQRQKAVRQTPVAQEPKRVYENRLSFKEKREFEQLEAEIPQLEQQKAELETRMSSGAMSVDELMEASVQISNLIEEIDSKSMRWLELSERV